MLHKVREVSKKGAIAKFPFLKPVKMIFILDSPYSPVNLGFDLEQIATEMIFAGSNSLNSAS